MARCWQFAYAAFDFSDLLEGLKRAQRFRLEDQRGTEINFELPDFLKDNNKLRKYKVSDESIAKESNAGDSQKKPLGKTPQPAPRLSINRNHDSEHSNGSPEKNITRVMLKDHTSYQSDSHNDTNTLKSQTNGIVPPPLPPKPKVKPTWNGAQLVEEKLNGSAAEHTHPATLDVRKIKSPIANRINMLNSAVAASEKKFAQPRTIYFDQLNSSFVWVVGG